VLRRQLRFRIAGDLRRHQNVRPAQKAGKLTVDQLTAARDKLYDQTQVAQADEDWAGYCKSIDDMRAELGL
jgi:hypothetical protein